MAKFWVDYDASMLIEAETAEEAAQIFYQCYSDETRGFAEIKNIEEEKEES